MYEDASHLLDEVAGSNVDDNVFRIRELARDIQRIGQRYQHGLVWRYVKTPIAQEHSADSLAFRGWSSPTFSMHVLNFA